MAQQDPSQARRKAVDLAEQNRLSLWHFRQLGWKALGKRVGADFLKEDVTGRAAQLAYYFFFALFPMLIAASAVIGLAARSAGDLNAQLLGYLGKALPPSAYDLVNQTFHQTTTASSGSKVLLGALVALWSASAGTSAIQDTLNGVYNVEDSRPFWRARLSAIVLTIAVGALFFIALSVLLGGDKLVEHFHVAWGVAALIAVRLLTWPVAFCLVALGFAIVYWKAPDVKDQPWQWVTPGAAIGIVLWLLASLALRVYLHFFNSYSVTYGSLGAVILLLTWFYISGVALLLGAVINKTLATMLGEAETAREKGAAADPPPAARAVS